MPRKAPPKRKYDSSRRKEQARQTRLQIAEAARKLFLERGYAGATIEAIAQEAGVAPETIYATFKNKHRLLVFLLDISLGGDDQPMRLLDRPRPQAILEQNDQRQQLAGFSQDMADILGRAAPVLEIMRLAAKTEPAIARRVKRLFKERLQSLTDFVSNLARNGPLRNGLDLSRAGEIVWTITSPEVFLLLTRDRSWSKEVYADWLQDTLTRLLLP